VARLGRALVGARPRKISSRRSRRRAAHGVVVEGTALGVVD